MKASLLFQYIAASVVWGASFLFMKVGLEGLSFTQVVLWRLVFGALALALVSTLNRIGLPRDHRIWKHMSFLAALQCVVPWLLFSWAEQSMSSGLASIYNATTPLMTMAASLAFLPGETLTRHKASGLMLGFLGVLIVLSPWNIGVGGSVSAQIACLGATASYGVSFVYLRRFVLPLGVDTRTIALLQISIGALFMVIASPVIANTPMHLTPAIVGSMIALGAFGTGLAFIWNTNVVQGWGPTAASTVTYLSPVVGVALGALVLGESLGWNQPLGASIVIAGILVTKRATRSPIRVESATTPLSHPRPTA